MRLTMGRMPRFPTGSEVAAPFQSKQAFLDFIRAPQEPVGGEAVVGNSTWSNKDLEPSSIEQRTWTW